MPNLIDLFTTGLFMHYIYGSSIGNSSGGNLNIAMSYVTFNFLSKRSSKYTTIRDIMIDLSSAYGSIYINASGSISSAIAGYNTIQYGSLCALRISNSSIYPIFTYVPSNSTHHSVAMTNGNISLSNLAQNAVTDTVINLYN